MKSGHYDIVAGSRYVPGSIIQRRTARRIISFFYNAGMHLLLGSKIHDHQCGLKVFDAKTVMPLIEDMGYDKTFSRGWFWDAELLIRAQKKGLKILELPVAFCDTDTSTFNLGRELRCLPWIFKLIKELAGNG